MGQTENYFSWKLKMAKAKAMTTYNKPPVPNIVLELSSDEVKALHDVLGLVGGSMEYSRRKFTDAILNAITGTRPDAFDNGDRFRFIEDAEGRINFN